jgi:hypothetical protein
VVVLLLLVLLVLLLLLVDGAEGQGTEGLQAFCCPIALLLPQYGWFLPPLPPLESCVEKEAVTTHHHHHQQQRRRRNRDHRCPLILCLNVLKEVNGTAQCRFIHT